MKRNKRKEVDEGSIEDVIIDAERIETTDYTEKTIVSKIHKIYSLASATFYTAIFSLIVISLIFFVKIRSDTIDIQFAKGVVLKNIKNLAFSGVSIGWDFELNRLAIVLKNTVWKPKQIIIPELRLYPTTKSLLRLECKIEKAAIVNPNILINFDGTKLMTNKDWLSDINSKKSEFTLETQAKQILISITGLMKEKIDIRHGLVTFKNRGFIIGTASDVDVFTDDQETSISMTFARGSERVPISFKIRYTDNFSIAAKFKNLMTKYLRTFIDVPLLGDSNISGEVVFSPKSDATFMDLLNRGRFSIIAENSSIHVFDKAYTIPKCSTSGSFDENKIKLDSAVINQGDARVSLWNIEYIKPNHIIEFNKDSKIHLMNCKIPAIDSTEYLPITIKLAHVDDAVLYPIGYISLTSPENHSIALSKYSAKFTNSNALICGNHLIENGNGSIEHKNGRTQLQLTSGMLSGRKVKNLISTEDNGWANIKFAGQVPFHSISSNSLIKNITDKLQNPRGTFDGTVSVVVDRKNGKEVINGFDGLLTISDPMLSKHHLRINNAKAVYDGSKLEISGYLKPDNRMPFQITSNSYKQMDLAVSGDVNAAELSSIGIPVGTLTGNVYLVLDAKCSQTFIKVTAKTDLTHATVRLPIIGVIKNYDEKGIGKLDTIIRGSNIAHTFNMTTNGTCLSGNLTISDGQIANSDITVSNYEGSKFMSIRTSSDGGVNTIIITGTPPVKLADVYKDIITTPQKTSINVDLSNANASDSVSFDSLKGYINLSDGRINNLILTGMFQNKKSISIQSKLEEGLLNSSIKSNDAGMALNLFNITNVIDSGSMHMMAFSDDKFQQINGMVTLSNFTIKNMGLLHNILSLTSPLGNSFSDAITFNALKLKFKKNGKFISVTKGQLISPSIWLTMLGVYDTESDRFKVEGEAVPMHMYISQKQLWISKYLITGSVDYPTVEASPLREIDKAELIKKFRISDYKFIFE